MANIIKLHDASIGRAADEAARVLRDGGIVVYPTDTLYGIGCIVTNDEALANLYDLKGRAVHMPLPVMIARPDDLAGLAVNVSREAWKLMQAFWPGALTVVLQARKEVSKLLLGGGESIGIRMPNSELCRRMVIQAGNPVVTTSANRSGEPPVDTIRALPDSILRRIDLAIDGGEIPGGTPSSVIDFTGGKCALLREGALSLAALKRVLPDIEKRER